MKRFNTIVAFLMLVSACKGQETEKQTNEEGHAQVNFESFGKRIDTKKSITTDVMYAKYMDMEVTDTIQTKFTGKVTDVCQAKGCWMKLELKDGQETMVRFKDYGFFMPKDITGKEVVVNGWAYVEQMSVEDQKHYAEDSGASEEEIARITGPKKTFAFQADGVLLKK